MEYKRLTQENFDKAREFMVEERKSEFDVIFAKARQTGASQHRLQYRQFLAFLSGRIVSENPSVKKVILHFLPNGVTMVLLQMVTPSYKPVDIEKAMKYFYINKYK